jgi:hypothetical protein
MRVDTPSLLFHVARAYGVSPTIGVARSEPARPAESVAREPQAPDRRNLDRLVAGVVPGGVDFEDGESHRVRDGVISMYTRAGARNEAATGVAAGRVLDVSG